MPRKLAMSIGAVALTRYLSLAVSMGVGVILARSLNVDERGELAVALALAGVVAVILTAGLDTATLWAAAGEDRLAALVVSKRRTLVSLLLSAIATTSLLLRPTPSIFGADPRVLAMAAMIVPLLVVNQLFGNCAIASGAVRQWSFASLLNLVVYAAASSSIALSDLASAHAYLIAFAIGHLAQALVLRQGRTRLTATTKSITSTARVTSVARGSAAPAVVQVALLRVPVPLLSLLAGLGAAGVMAIALPFVEALLVLPVAAGSVLLPSYGAAGYGRAAIVRHAGRIALLAAIASALVFIAAPTLVPWVYGSEYAPAARLIQILMPGVVAFTFARVLQSGLQARSHFRPVTLSSCAGLLCLIVSEVLLVPSLGTTGAAVALALALLVTATGVWLGFRRTVTDASEATV